MNIAAVCVLASNDVDVGVRAFFDMVCIDRLTTAIRRRFRNNDH